jgi:hypothetical protein
MFPKNLKSPGMFWPTLMMNQKLHAARTTPSGSPFCNQQKANYQNKAYPKAQLSGQYF